jgi:hypothetical protein
MLRRVSAAISNNYIWENAVSAVSDRWALCQAIGPLAVASANTVARTAGIVANNNHLKQGGAVAG